MPIVLALPWRWSDEQRPQTALLFASRFDGSGIRQGRRLLVGGMRLRRAVLGAPGALGVSLRAYPFQGRYYTLSLWRDQESLLAFANDPAHRRAVRSLAELGPAQGVLASRDADPRRRPAWRDTVRWLTTLDPGPYRHDPQPSSAGPRARPVRRTC
jgi:hypothetical protein